MHKYILITLTLSLGVFWGPTPGWAQDSQEEPTFLDSVKSQMVSVSEESAALADENKALKSELIGLQLEVEQLRQQVEKLDAGYEKEQKQERERTTEIFDFKGMGKDELVQEAQNIYLSGQAMPLDDLQRLRELQLYELQYRRQELDLEWQLTEFLCRKTQETRRSQTTVLEKAIEDNQAKTREVLALIAEEKRKSFALPRQIEILRTENRALQREIRELKKYAR